MLLLYNEENKIIGVTNEWRNNTVEYNGDKKIPFQSVYKEKENIITSPDGEVIELSQRLEENDFVIEEV